MNWHKLAVMLGWLSLVPASIWAVTVAIPGGGGVSNVVANSWTALQTFVDANFTGKVGLGGTRASTEYDIEAKKILRVSGNTGSATTGKGVELAGDLSGENYITSYNRDGSAYMIMYINAAPLKLNTNNAYADVGGQWGLWSRTSAQIQVLAPQAVGFNVFNSTLNLPCYSTATAAGSWARYTDASTCW